MRRCIVSLAGMVIVIMLTGTSAVAKVDFETDIRTDTTWTKQHGPYQAAVDVTVAEGVILTLEAGVEVLLGEDRTLVVQGGLVARGTAADPIQFNWMGPQQGERWGSLVFEDTSTDAAFKNVDDYVYGSILEYCVFEHGTKAVRLHSASPFISNCTFRENFYSSMDVADIYGGAALFIGEGSSPRVRDCNFEGNVAEGAAQGGAVCVDRAQPILQDNSFLDNTSIYGGGVTTNNMASPIVGNTFEGNEGTWEGGGIALVSGISAFLNNTVTGNHSINDGGGVHVCVTCFPHANPIVMDNVITGNTNDVEGAAGFGAAYLRVFAYNTLHSNTMGEDPLDFGWFNELHDHYPTWVVNPVIANNWWGTTDTSIIEAAIHDGNDEPVMGIASFEPVLTQAPAGPQTRVTITSTKIRYDQKGESMPVHLTLYNPGPARSVELMIRLEYPEIPPILYRDKLDFPDAERIDDAYRLALPENSVWFSTIIAPEWPGNKDPNRGVWVAELFDTASGERIGDPCDARFELGEGGVQ